MRRTTRLCFAFEVSDSEDDSRRILEVPTCSCGPTPLEEAGDSTEGRLSAAAGLWPRNFGGIVVVVAAAQQRSRSEGVRTYLLYQT